MLFIDNQGVLDPTINLAIEEYALRHIAAEEPILLFYINKPSIIIGRNQNTIEEINTSYVTEHDIQVVRRLSGGGAVYHDEGNLNFSFITPNDGRSFANFKRFLEPIIEALQKMGIDAEVKGRNDVLIGERKVSGNAQYATGGKLFTHGTLLFNSHISEVVNALKVRKDKIESKGLKSIRSRVANIAEFLTAPMDINEFREHILLSVFGVDARDQVREYKLTETDWVNIHALAKERYANWDWNYGNSPAFNTYFTKRFPSGSIDVHLNVVKGTITEVKIFGDFFGVGEVADIEQRLLNQPYNPSDLRAALADVDITHYFGPISLTDFIELLY